MTANIKYGGYKQMSGNKLVFFETPKENLKFTKLFSNDKLLNEIAASSDDPASLPDVCAYYTTPVVFPAAPEDRPYITSSIALSADGKMAFSDNKAGPLVAKNNYLDPDGSLGDFWVLNILRAYADGVIVGGNTLKNEPGISCHVYDSSLHAQRIKVLGKKHHPVEIVTTLDGTDIPFDHFSLHVDPSEEFKVVFSTSPKGAENIRAHSPLKHVYYGPFNSREELDAWTAPELYTDYDVIPVIITGDSNGPDSPLFLYALRKLGIKNAMVESPTYTFYLIKLGLLDEYFITYSMTYAGGAISPGYNMPLRATDHAHSNLLSIGMHKANFMYTRQQLVYGAKCEQSLVGYKY